MPCYLLGVAVVKIREVEMTVCGANLHLGEGVADIRVAQFIEPNRSGAIGLDGNQLDTLGGVVGGDGLDAVFIELRRGAMIARENDDEHFAGDPVARMVNLPVGSEQFERRHGGTYR